MTYIQIVIISACPDGWKCEQDLGKCYCFIADYMNWSEANARCAALDTDKVATLTSIRSQAENDIVISLMGGGWIGGNDQDAEGEWR